MATLHEAILLNDLERIQDLLRQVQDVNKKNASGRTPLAYCAVTQGLPQLISEPRRLTIAGLLFSYGADPNVVDKFGWSMIHTCAWNNDLPLLQMCVRKGGKVNVPNHQKQLPVEMASIRGNTEVVEYLETQSCDMKAQCRSLIRKAMGKKVHRIKELPLPPSLKLYINHGCPYNGWEATLVPEAPWSVNQLSEVGKRELKQFIEENASQEFLDENKEHLQSMSDLMDTFQSLYLWESFKTVNFEEPLPREPRYSLDPNRLEGPREYLSPDTEETEDTDSYTFI